VSATQGIEQIYVAVPASYDGDRVVLRAASPLDEVTAIAAQARRTGLILLAFALVFAAIVAARIIALAVAPIGQLADAAQAMADGRLNAQIPTATGELAVLSDALQNLRNQVRRRLEDLEADERNLRAVLDGLPEAVFQLRGDRIMFANRAADGLFKRPVTGWHGNTLDNVGLPASLHAGVLEAPRQAADAAFECGPDLQGRYLWVSVVTLESPEESPHVLVTVSDITDRIRVDAVRRDFVANASHELKTPVSGIQLLAESAANAAQHGDTETAVDFARQIAEESSRLSRLVRDLLDLSRLESEADATGATDVRAAAKNAILGHKNSASDAGLDIVFVDEAAGVDAYAVADATDVAVALDNLLDNAIKYTESGTVTVSIGTNEDGVLISVRDTGIGIPAEDLPRIFERFYRVDRARSRESGGTGLGLSLVRHVVERSEGTLHVSSEPGQGSTFTITLPMTPSSG
jgi:two-component system phosphate regulon sensor histidine kinase PhoR